MNPEISVVIPTHNRLDVLPEVLAALAAQRTSVPFEVVVVDDGSSDGTGEWLESWRPAYSGRFLCQENQGPAAARNAGVAAAEGRLVAFLGDDTVPTAGWLAAHRQAHGERGNPDHLAVIGYTRWHPRMHRNAFLDYVNEYGLQFGYALIRDPRDVPFNFLYTSNLSISRELLLAEPFDLRFPYAAWEDIEAGYRLQTRRGMRLVYQPEAVTLHDHPTSFDRFAERQEKAGYSAVVFYGLHPELGDFLGLGPAGPPPLLEGWRARLRGTLARTLQHIPMSALRFPRLWQEALRAHYIRGLHRGWRDEAHRKEKGS